jgi:N-acetylmuramoyl-L-alanine amidase
MVDPGHGGEDGGAKGPKGLKEKTAALALAKAVAVQLEAAGFQALNTRDDDTFIPLWDRSRAANAQGADLFLSLHLNAARAKAARGSEVYFLSLGKGDDEDVVAAENAGAGAAAGLAPGSPDSVVASILDDLAQKAFLQDSEQLAVAVQGQLNRLAGIKERGVKQAPFIVLRGAAMPAVLVEVAFISNPKEEAKLMDPAFRTKAAEAITQGVRHYFAQTNGSVRRRLVAGPE